MIGNAVPVEFARILAQKIMLDLKEYKNNLKKKPSFTGIRRLSKKRRVIESKVVVGKSIYITPQGELINK